ncbi:hypothetical protein BYT27DRAFT_7137468 [Phlegmacium glaucopus]|nr:hypothetical protein BYT27DRAFT_7137468 [Phlegmacium glaucopus]
MAEQGPCIHPVSLPSIHEMFPAHLMRSKVDYNSRHKYPEAADSHHCQHCQTMSMPSRSRCSHSPVPHSRMLPQTHPYPHHTEKNVAHHDPRLLDIIHESEGRPHADPRKRSPSQIYSFDLLRSDPIHSSLQHLTSTESLPTNPQQHLGPNAVASGSSFRVSVPPTTATSIQVPVSMEGRSRAPQRRDPDPAVPAMISFPVSRPASGSSKPNQSPSEDVTDDDNPGESAGKKHICPTCLKRFNRPSSLRIHVNTHTGATPFRCPWPNCGREFNVNSNMRRHYRNHTTPGFSRAQPNDNRRKRRRVDTLDALSHPMPAVDQAYRKPHPANLMPSPPISHFSASDDSEYDSEIEAESYPVQERDELVDYRTKPPAYRSATANLTRSMARASFGPVKPQHGGFSPYGATSRYHQRQHPYGDAHVRPLTPGSSLQSSSPSNSPSPRPPPDSMPPAYNRHYSYSHSQTTKREQKYNPSAPYMHSLADTRVSTALRPAFHS